MHYYVDWKGWQENSRPWRAFVATEQDADMANEMAVEGVPIFLTREAAQRAADLLQIEENRGNLYPGRDAS